jgi:hypothetical protein
MTGRWLLTPCFVWNLFLREGSEELAENNKIKYDTVNYEIVLRCSINFCRRENNFIIIRRRNAFFSKNVFSRLRTQIHNNALPAYR